MVEADERGLLGLGYEEGKEHESWSCFPCISPCCRGMLCCSWQAALLVYCSPQGYLCRGRISLGDFKRR